MRMLRILAAGVWYFVCTAVNNREPLFWSPLERARFMRVLNEARASGFRFFGKRPHGRHGLKIWQQRGLAGDGRGIADCGFSGRDLTDGTDSRFGGNADLRGIGKGCQIRVREVCAVRGCVYSA
ncbi:MAG: hypothetical protein LBK61_02000 [Spirochaetaceae bacterium]|nr:hypothetical protein [Spirochaetaceae bacterium]